ncbi:hypothetical protein Aph01nite_15560 [Acrocarpospora phusangensis]|uniref:Uncharacterized protein n=1 Tax=Acrocarpospora phusangensis TaxID=1070424 RepID=A0A919Q6V2_9ACTN|nr:hypothetical protein [Acrocarpospora phusangensis]GIH23246.1 hypothetical protein Aph01nite_15560 [Acrocarpospora phusangensis]
MGERLDDRTVSVRLEVLEELLAELEAASAETALDAVALLAEVYGEALARVMDRADPELRTGLTRDVLLAHLLALHDIQPEKDTKTFIPADALLRKPPAKAGGTACCSK